MVRNFRLDMNGKTIFELEASGDEEAIKYFFNQALCGHFGILDALKSDIAKKAAKDITNPLVEVKGDGRTPNKTNRG